MSHPANDQLIDLQRDHDREMVLDVSFQGDTCTRCGGKDTGEDGETNMVDGKAGLCAVCASDMGAL
jgi:hypothetical protein